MKIASSKRGLESDLDDWRDEVGVDVRSKGGQGKGTTVCAPAWIPGYFLETGGSVSKTSDQTSLDLLSKIC